jgi:predicted small lipoprotein YifL
MKTLLKIFNVLILLLILLLLGCAQKRPVLYPNSHLMSVGKEAAQADIDDCIQLAKDYGTDSDKGNEIVKSSAKGAAVGAATGGAVGAVTGNFGRGLAAGAAGGAAAGGTRQALRSGDPDPVFKRFVEKCLRKRGYEPIGWK